MAVVVFEPEAQVDALDAFAWYEDQRPGLGLLFRNANQKRVFQDALQLPPEARAALAAELIATLDDEADADAEALWSEEIRKRLEEVDTGLVRPIPWAEARRRILNAAGRDPAP